MVFGTLIYIYICIYIYMSICIPAAQLPFKEPQIPSSGDHKALNRGTLGDVAIYICIYIYCIYIYLSIYLSIYSLFNP